MLGHEQANRRLSWLWGVVLLAFLASPLYAYDRQRRQRPRRERPRRDAVRTVEPKLSEEGQAGFRDVEAALKELLTVVNQNQQPDQILLDKAAGLLSDNKRYSSDYADNQKAAYMLLQAWVSYYDEDLATAMNWSMRAAKTDETHRDAWVSSAIFCLLNDKRPKLPRPPKPTPTRSSRRDEDYDRRPSMGRPDQSASMQNGTLNFELTALRQEIFSERYEQIDYKKQWGDQIDYDPATDTLCVLFWQSDADAAGGADPNDMTPEERRAAKMREKQKTQTPGRSQHSPKLELKAQQKYFKQIAEACKDEKTLKFIEVNTDVPKVAEKVQEQRLIDMADEEDIPLLYAAETDLKPTDYAQISQPGPLMLVAAPGGKIKYAGPAADFVPVFILAATTGIEIDMKPVAQPHMPGMHGMPHMPGMEGRPDRPFVDPFLEMDPGMPGQMPHPRDRRDMRPNPMPRPGFSPDTPPGRVQPKVADPNSPPAGADPNTPAVAQPAPAVPEKKAPAPASKPAVKKELTAQDRYDAERLLSLAELQINSSRKIRGKSPKKGVDACKEILEKYPGTEYADKAREHLQDVPKRLWDKYKIAELLDL